MNDALFLSRELKSGNSSNREMEEEAVRFIAMADSGGVLVDKRVGADNGSVGRK